MQVDVDPGPGGVAPVLTDSDVSLLSGVDVFLNLESVIIGDVLVVNVVEALQIIISFLEAACVLTNKTYAVLVTVDAEVVDITDIVVEVEESMDEQGPLYCQHCHQHV